MSEARRWTVTCEDASDGSGDLLVEVPAELLAEKRWLPGAAFSIECVDGAIILKPIGQSPGEPSEN